MSEYIIKGETLTAMADEVRSLSGKTENLSPNMMTMDIGEANDEISSQASLISQIGDALESKGGSVASGDDQSTFQKLFEYTVNEIEGASYGFTKNSNGYYESQNKGQNDSYAICRVYLTVNTPCDITFDVINYAESNYDYAVFGVLDTALALSNSVDSTVKETFKGRQSDSVVNVTYSGVSTGSHYIDIKFIKDNSQSNNNDSVQFKIQERLVTNLTNNTTNLQAILDAVNALPEDVELPTLTNEGSASDLLSGKQLIDSDGNVVTGTFSIDSELTTQDDLITQIQNAVDNLPEAGGGGGSDIANVQTCTVELTTVYDIEDYMAFCYDANNNCFYNMSLTGGITPRLAEPEETIHRYTISNVVCGSIIVFMLYVTYPSSIYLNISRGEALYSDNVGSANRCELPVHVTANEGETCEIQMGSIDY